jgi:hypothetical protein
MFKSFRHIVYTAVWQLIDKLIAFRHMLSSSTIYTFFSSNAHSLVIAYPKNTAIDFCSKFKIRTLRSTHIRKMEETKKYDPPVGTILQKYIRLKKKEPLGDHKNGKFNIQVVGPKTTIDYIKGLAVIKKEEFNFHIHINVGK